MAQQTGEIDVDGLEEIIAAVLSEGYTLKDFTNITDQETEAAYTVAFNLVNQGNYDAAERVLEYLCQIDNYDARFWMGLGICRQQMKRFADATQAYALAGVLDVDNPMPALRAAECYLALGNLEAADSGLTAALHWAGEDPRHAGARQRATALMEVLNRQTERE